MATAWQSFTSWLGDDHARAIGLGLVAAFVLYQVLFAVAACCRRARFSKDVVDRHVLITGGSQGLGLSLAKQAAAAGARVTIVARRQEVLDAAKEDVVAAARAAGRTVTSTTCCTASADVTKEEAMHACVKAATERSGPVFMAISCAGAAHTGKLVDVKVEAQRRQMDLNYFGAVNLVRACLPSMQDRTERTHLVIVSSALALTGYVGYVAYAPTKWALRGLAEVLRNELLPHNIMVHSAYPPNMDTPGFEIEERTKPKETKAIESFETTYKPDDVAVSVWDALRAGEFHITCGDPGISVLMSASVGMSVRPNPVLDLVLLPLLLLIAPVYRYFWDREVRKPKYRDSLLSGNGDGAASSGAGGYMATATAMEAKT